MRSRPARTSAFTLLELILVLAILTLVAAAIVPSLSGFAAGRGTVDSATLIVSLTQYGRTQAVTRGCNYRLNFDLPNAAFWLTTDETGPFASPTSDFGKVFRAAAGVRMETDVAPQPDGRYIQFRASGRTDAARIWLTDRLGKSVEVASSSATDLFRVVPAEEMSR